MNDRLYRSTTDRVVSGVCGGLAARFNLDPSLVRVVWVILGLLTGIIPLLVLYVIMAIVVPEAPVGWPGASWSGGTWWPNPPAGPAAPTGGIVPPAAEGSPPPPPTPGGWTPPGAAPSSSPPTAAPGWSGPADWSSARRHGERSDPTGAIVVGLILVAIGVLFLVRQAVPDVDWDRVWPLGLVAIGAVLLLAAFRRS